ncbi:MAG: gamma-glutamyl-gamma-aminobutyrate hydrolase family protein [Paracoccaceae bacterium]
MRAPVILLTCDTREDVGQQTETLLHLRANYAAAIHAAGGLPLILPPEPEALPDALALCHGVLLTGSDAGAIVPTRRAAFEQALIEQAIRRRLPILGICHGMQMLGQALGGAIERDDPALLSPSSPHLPRAVPDVLAHDIGLAPGSILGAVADGPRTMVNSLHRHRLVGTGRYVVTAKASDGVIEGIESDTTPFCVGVQWHPEYRLTRTDSRLLCAFVAAATHHQDTTQQKDLS